MKPATVSATVPVRLDPTMPNMTSTGDSEPSEKPSTVETLARRKEPQAEHQVIQIEGPPSEGEFGKTVKTRLEWVPLDPDPNGLPFSYVCEDRDMKIAVNLRREHGERLDPRTAEWLFYRMGKLEARGRDLNKLFRYADSM